jgi:hypothetical protein
MDFGGCQRKAMSRKRTLFIPEQMLTPESAPTSWTSLSIYIGWRVEFATMEEHDYSCADF